MDATSEELEPFFPAVDRPKPKLCHITAGTQDLSHTWAGGIAKRVLQVVFFMSAVFIIWFLFFRKTCPEIHALPATVQISLGTLFNNQGVTWEGDAVRGGFDGNGSTYRAEEMPSSSINGLVVTYSLPPRWGFGADNIIADGQTIVLERPIQSHSIHILLADDYVDGSFTKHDMLILG